MTQQSTPNYVIVKSTKSTGVAILLTILLGPIGLFYASVAGGLVMTLTPLFLFVLMIIGMFGDSTILFTSSFMLLIFLAMTAWLISIIWAVVAVGNYNRDLLENAHSIQPATTDNTSTLSDITAKSETPTEFYTPYDSGNTGAKTVLILLGITIIFFLLYRAYDKQSSSFSFNKFTNTFVDPHAKDKDEIKNVIENTYLGYFNGSYSFGQSPSQAGGAFYNNNYLTNYALTIGIAFGSFMTGGVKVEIHNVDVYEFVDENTANVKYDIVGSMSDSDKQDSLNVDMTVKKIGGNWKLDAEKFLPIENDKPKKKHKRTK